jgi:hypothetical protein
MSVNEALLPTSLSSCIYTLIAAANSLSRVRLSRLVNFVDQYAGDEYTEDQAVWVAAQKSHRIA